MPVLALLLLLPGQIETVKDSDFSAELQTKAVSATVQIVNLGRRSAGSGVVIGKGGPFLYVLTAAHVVEGPGELEVRTFSPRSYPKPETVSPSAKVVARLPLEDLALVRFPAREPLPAVLKVCPSGQVAATREFRALAVGCSNGRPPTCQVEQVKGKRLVRKQGQEGMASFWELSRPTVKGRSGGPLLDRRGYVLGVASLAGDGRGYYGHLEGVHRLLDAEGFGWLYRDP
jgi:S1-C subfamily serine protease